MVLVTSALVGATAGGTAALPALRLPGIGALAVVDAVLVSIGLLLLLLGLGLLNALLAGRMSSAVFTRVRERLFASFTHTSWPVQEAERDGHLQEVLVTCATQFAIAVQNAALYLASVVSLLALLLSALVVDAAATLAVLGALAALALAVRPLVAWGRRLSAATAEANLELTTLISQRVSLAQEIAVFDVGEELRGRFEALAQRISGFWLRRYVIARAVPSCYREGALIILLGLLALFSASETARLAELGAVTLILARALTYAQSVQSASQQLHDSLPWTEKVWEREAMYEAARVAAGGERLARIETLALQDVAFSYRPGVAVLEGLTLAVARGEAIGIIGPSGGGKTTLVQLLLRLRAPDAGRYLVNGRDAEEYGSRDWFRRVGYVPQDPRTFAGSVAENIAFFRRGFGPERIERAARLAHVHDAVRSWPEGYATLLGDRGGAVSGGQRQRLAIARALLSDPDVLILDEPTSALDPGSEALLQATIASLRGRVTLFIIAHRLASVQGCDRILVLEGGRITALDSPERLAATSPYYREALRRSDPPAGPC